MASIMLKDIPEGMHAHLKQEAAANFRSLTQEALARIELSFRMEEAFNTKRDEKWIQEALESGPEEPLSRAKFDAVFRKARSRFGEAKMAGS
jgi:plasmid stability protein